MENEINYPDSVITEQFTNVEKITVGVVAYSTPLSTLEKTVASLTVSDSHVFIVLLCNSPDKKYQKDVESLCDKYDIRFFGNQLNRGFGSGHNLIARTFPSDWYICCNPDVVVRPNTILELVKFGERQKDAVLLMPRVLSEDGTTQPLARRTLTPIRWFYRQLWRVMPRLFKPFELRFDYYKTQPVDFVTGCFFAVKQSNFWKLGGFDESFFLYTEDADLSYRAKSIGVNYFVSSSEITHVWTTNETRNHKTIRQELRSLSRYFTKHRLWVPLLRFNKFSS
jgi:hypothetical protein